VIGPNLLFPTAVLPIAIAPCKLSESACQIPQKWPAAFALAWHRLRWKAQLLTWHMDFNVSKALVRRNRCPNEMAAL
jgi:hypothetical protein